MPNDNADSGLLGELERYAIDISYWRVEVIEKGMRRAPEAFLDYAKARTDIEREKASLIQKLGGDSFMLEPLMNTLMAYHGELVFEVYKQAVLDGGRIYHAFVTGDLPIKGDAV